MFINHNFCIFTDDQTRVRLPPIEGIPGSDYINANFIEVSSENELVFYV